MQFTTRGIVEIGWFVIWFDEFKKVANHIIWVIVKIFIVWVISKKKSYNVFLSKLNCFSKACIFLGKSVGKYKFILLYSYLFWGDSLLFGVLQAFLL